MSSDDIRKESLRQLLKSRRRELNAASVGLPERPHSRSRGLSLEEAAMLARLSVRGYSQLENGHHTPRPETLDAVAGALRMDERMRIDFYFLATEHRVAPPRPPTTAEPCHWGLADASAPHPAVVTDHASTVLAHNAPAVDLFAETGSGSLTGTNLTLWTFTEEAARGVDGIAALRRAAVARLKVTAIAYHDDKPVDEVITRLHEIPGAALLWRHERARTDRGVTLVRYRRPEHRARVLTWTRIAWEDGSILHTGLPHAATLSDTPGLRP
ncbi:helix-turn-helix domain-containing protein [Yinghuangia sp. ASG 101]|uniref:helix-turn-helix domain-containing protein n=1 Tax=Yinghuangia sp. ASG 101 TaxID=2896848 RepID=UPI001E61CF9B|nr:helix-turn-helix domain-containing protein [Yinghuangia sp. ASG 101]UGQ10514.1 helix-turn-helix domain-containing protein [Yinghuangia sp. ASG 101]